MKTTYSDTHANVICSFHLLVLVTRDSFVTLVTNFNNKNNVCKQ